MLPNYHRDLHALGYETAHIGKWHMGNDAQPRPGYDLWVSFKGHGSLFDPSADTRQGAQCPDDVDVTHHPGRLSRSRK